MMPFYGFGQIQTPMDILTHAIMQHKRSPARLVLSAELAGAIWQDRNTSVFRQLQQLTALYVVVQNSIRALEALKGTLTSVKKLTRLTSDILVRQAVVHRLNPPQVVPSARNTTPLS
jgi:hypothetical protein